MKERNRRITPKGILEKMSGKKIDPSLLPNIHKVQILEYLLTCPASEIETYQQADVPEFIYESAKLLTDGKMLDFVGILNLCRQMAKEDSLNAN